MGYSPCFLVRNGQQPIYSKKNAFFGGIKNGPEWLKILRGILCKVRARVALLQGRPRYLTDQAELLHAVLLWGPNYEMDVLKF